MPKKMTLEELAAMTKRGFDAVGEEIHSGTKQVLTAISDLKLEISSHPSRKEFEKLHEWVKEIDERLAGIERKPK